MFCQHELPECGVTNTGLKLEEQLDPGLLQRLASLLQSAEVIIEYWVEIHGFLLFGRELQFYYLASVKTVKGSLSINNFGVITNWKVNVKVSPVL